MSDNGKKHDKIFEAELVDGNLSIKIHPCSLKVLVLAERMLGMHIDNMLIKADIESAQEKDVIETQKNKILIPSNILKRME